MAEIEVDVTVGGVLPLTVPSITTSNTPMQGGGILAGWSMRDVVADTLANVSGSVVAPAAGATIVATSAIPFGTYEVEWIVGLQGAAAAADANNFQLFNDATAVETSVNTGAAGAYIQASAVFTVANGTTVSVKAVGAGTAGVTYTAQLNLNPTGKVETIAEITSGNDVLGEISLVDATSDTQFFGSGGPIIQNGLTITVVSGAIKGTVYVVPNMP